LSSHSYWKGIGQQLESKKERTEQEKENRKERKKRRKEKGSTYVVCRLKEEEI